MSDLFNKDKRSYRSISVTSSVCVKVPQTSFNMLFYASHEFDLGGKMVHVPDHWRNSFQIQDTSLIIQRNFFGISGQDLGRKITASVEVVEKTTYHGKILILLNITKEVSARPTCDLKFSPEGDGIALPDTNVKVVFKSR